MSFVVGRPDVPIVIDPQLDLGNLPEVIVEEVRRIIDAMDDRGWEHITRAEAYTYLDGKISFSGSNCFTRFRLRFHYCCEELYGKKWNEDYGIVQKRENTYSIRHLPATNKSEIPCH